MQLVDLSRTDRWNTLVRENDYNIDELYLHVVPAILLEKIAFKAQNHWETLASSAQNYCNALTHITPQKIENAKQYIDIISHEKSPYNVHMLISTIEKVTSLKNLKDILLDGAITQSQKEQDEISLQRAYANQSMEMGTLCEIAKDTLIDLGHRIEDMDGWKQLADGLGFENATYRKIQNPFQMLKKWMHHYYRTTRKSATIARLCFEAQQAKMNIIPSFLKAIPIEGKSKIQNFLHSDALIDCPLTRYHLNRIEELSQKFSIQINWERSIFIFGPSTLKTELERTKINPVDLIWQSGSVSTAKLLSIFKNHTGTHLIAHKLEKEIKEGSFQPKNSGGIKFATIWFLGATQYSMTTMDEVSIPNDFFTSLKKSFEEIFSNEIIKLPDPNPFGTLAEKCFKRSKALFPEMNFDQFLKIFWQYHDNLNLFDFCSKLIFVLEQSPEIKKSDLIKNLKKQMKEILPYRSYSPELAAANVKKQKKQEFLRQQADMLLINIK